MVPISCVLDLFQILVFEDVRNDLLIVPIKPGLFTAPQGISIFTFGVYRGQSLVYGDVVRGVVLIIDLRFLDQVGLPTIW